MDNYKCYACNTPLVKSNYTKEHIIPNSIGGRIKSSNLICRKCNTGFGYTIDAELAKQLDSLSVFIGVSRDRSKAGIIKNVKTDSGNIYHLKDGKNPEIIKPEITYKGSQINVVARDRKEVKQIINGLKRKHPNLDVENIKINESEHFLDETFNIDLSVGGEIFLRAIAKIGVNTYLHFNGDKKNISPTIIEIIKGKKTNDKHIHFFQSPDVTTWGKNEISHYVSITSDENNKLLYAYIILFNTYSFIVNLSDDFKGESFKIEYCFNLLTKKVNSPNIEINYKGRLHYIDYCEKNNKEANLSIINSLQTNINRVLQIAEHRQIKKTIREISEKAYSDVMTKYLPSQEMTEDMLIEILTLGRKKIDEYMNHLKRK